MKREYEGLRGVCVNYVIDDGWNVPESVVQVIDFRIEEAHKDAMKAAVKAYRNHKGDWITEKVARAYEKNSFVPRHLNGNQYTGDVRRLGLELQDKYGVTENEAINIMNGRHVREYVNKYDRIKNIVPDQVDSQFICDNVLEEYGYMGDEMYEQLSFCY